MPVVSGFNELKLILGKFDELVVDLDDDGVGRNVVDWRRGAVLVFHFRADRSFRRTGWNPL